MKQPNTKTTIITNSKEFAPRQRDEVETHVLYGMDETMTIYTSNPIDIRRFDKIYPRSREIMDNGKIFAVEYKIDKTLLTFRAKKRKSTMTDEQRQKVGERLRKARTQALAI